MATRFYVTTPIYYINDVPHLGSAYTTIAADVLARYHRLRGHETRFLTGTDEHGLKIQRVAEEQKVLPQTLADMTAEKFREAWPRLGCTPDDFIRTSEERHKRAVQDIWRKIAKNGDIYLGHYEGLYCVGCEAYYTEKDLNQPGNVCPLHQKPVEMVKEESYFFRLSRYEKRLLDFYAQNPSFVRPEGRFNEVISFVQAGLQDLSVSRTTFNWGVPVPDDPKHVMYVWFDALSNYLTALLAPEDNRRFWPCNVHLVGKDILRFHAVYWPAFLMAAGYEGDELPRQVFAHGFLTYCGQKMSKSLRNTISPVALAEALPSPVGVDVVRYVLMRAISFGQDGDFSVQDLLQRYSSELGNTLGNLLNRVLPFAKTVPPKSELTDIERELWRFYPATVKAVEEGYEQVNPTGALAAIFALLARANEYIDKAAPWAAKKRGDEARLGTIVATLIELLEAVSLMLAPVMPNVADAMRVQLGLKVIDWSAIKADLEDVWPSDPPTRKVGDSIRGGAPIFPRLEKEKEAEIIARLSPAPKAETMPVEGAAPVSASEKAAPGATPRKAKATIVYDDFAKLDMRIGVVVSAERVKKKDKLLDLRVDTGDATPRRIISGIATVYTPEEMMGKRVVVVCNLAPRDFGKGLVSEGMLLTAEDDTGFRLLSVEGDKGPGAEVS